MLLSFTKYEADILVMALSTSHFQATKTLDPHEKTEFDMFKHRGLEILKKFRKAYNSRTDKKRVDSAIELFKDINKIKDLMVYKKK